MHFKSLFFRKAFFSFCLLLTCSAFIRCQAQVIVGKWEAISSKSYLTPEAAKEMNSPQVVTTSGPEAGKGVNEYKSDYSYIMSVTPPGSQEALIMKGKWKLSGDQLTITMDSPGNPSTIITVSFSGNTMTATSKMPPFSKSTKVETTYKKIN